MTPAVVVTEFGWVYDNIAESITQAMEVDLPWAAELYAQYPQVMGASIWYLGPGFGGIAGDDAIRLNILCDHRACSNDSAVPYGESR